MTAFLLVPLNFKRSLFTLGALFYRKIEEEGKRVIYTRAIDADLSPGEQVLEGELGIDGVCIPEEEAEAFFALDRVADLNEKIAAHYAAKELSPEEVLLAEGIAPDPERAWLFAENRKLAAILKAEVILLVNAQDQKPEGVARTLKIFAEQSFEADTAKLGFVLFHVAGDAKKYARAVEHALAEMKCVLAPLLSINEDLEGPPEIEELTRIAAKIDFSPLKKALSKPQDERLAPAVFRNLIITQAAKLNKRIVLPEGAEPRTVKAALICAEKKIARCVLLASPKELASTLKALGVATLPEGIEVVDPKNIRENYLVPLLTLRKKKGLTDSEARDLLADNVYVGTMMLAADEVDGLVSGAVHTTANTIRPALQIIKMDGASTMVSSVFFMLMPSEVYVFGDCAVNTELTAEGMAEVAIQAHDSAVAFGLQPKVAMISFSTYDSGSGPAVDKVREATEIVRQNRADIVIDGPLQYDAACVPAVGAKKAPGSKVAGQANVFIFPDLTTGNTVYKAVQRTGHILSIGPMLQGLKKAVNDLSRGATVDDIVFTIAITAIQAGQKENKKENEE